ncbi:MAG: oligosaccharide flippase family protein [Clostridia bacterium]|nr:oligosaccharide flippase family protein [Clostridia bacterium]
MRKFFKTVAVVTVFAVCEKILGFLYRIYMSRTVGAEGIGLYQVVLSVFGLIYTLCCSGIPVTVSRLMTKYKAENSKLKVQKVISAGLSVTLATSIPVALIFMFFGNHLSFIFADSRCMEIFLILMPGLIFTSVYSVLRGVFWGNKDFLPYSVIELLEELVMIVAGIILINHATDIFDGARRACVAVLISYTFSFLVATAVFFIRKNKLKNPLGELKPLLVSATPITVMRSANSFAISLVSIILPLRLVASGMSSELAMRAFGAAVGQAIPLLFIPTTLIGSLTLVLVPEISENYYRKNFKALKSDVEKSLKIAVFISCTFIPVFSVLGEEIGVLVFNSPECGKYLSVSSFLMVFMSLSNLTTSMLNSIGKEKQTLIYYIISGIFMLLSIWFLPKYIGVYSLLVGFTFVYGLTSVLNLLLLNKHCEEKPNYLPFTVSAIILTIPTVIFGLMAERLLSNLLSAFLSFIILGGVLVIFNTTLYLIFGLIDVKLFTTKLKRRTLKKRRA